MAQQYMRWTLAGSGSTDNLAYGPATAPAELGPDDVLVKMHAASLNYRDAVIAKGTLPVTQATPGIVPGSDGAGVVLRVGSGVSAFRAGDRVLMHMVPAAADEALPRMPDIAGGLGQALDGTLGELGVFRQQGLVRMPAGMGFAAAATLACSGLTAWNALMGLRGREVRAGDHVLVQGSGGVSVAALQFAVAAGATVVATTGKEANRARLTALGAAHVVNYRTDTTWGTTARVHTPGGRGFDHVVDVGGDTTLRQSLAAVRTDGVVSLVGVLGAAGTTGTPDTAVGALEALWTVCVVRGVLLGSKAMLRDMVRFCEAQHVAPALDGVVFGLPEAVAAYERLGQQQHFSKVVIQIRRGE